MPIDEHSVLSLLEEARNPAVFGDDDRDYRVTDVFGSVVEELLA